MSEVKLFESWDGVTQRSNVVTRENDGTLLIERSQNLRPIVEQCKRDASNFDWHGRNRDFTKVASIPLLIWGQLTRLGIAQDPKRLEQWLNERDNRVFRTDDGRKL